VDGLLGLMVRSQSKGHVRVLDLRLTVC